MDTLGKGQGNDMVLNVQAIDLTKWGQIYRRIYATRT